MNHVRINLIEFIQQSASDTPRVETGAAVNTSKQCIQAHLRVGRNLLHMFVLLVLTTRPEDPGFMALLLKLSVLPENDRLGPSAGIGINLDVFHRRLPQTQ